MDDDHESRRPFDGYDFSRRRRRRRTEDDIDDAWAAADEDDIPDEGVEIEELAVGYVEDPEQLEMRRDDDDLETGDLGPLPPNAERLTRRRTEPRPERIRERYDRTQAYSNSPSFRRSKQNLFDRAFSLFSGGSLGDVDAGPEARDTDYVPGPLSNIPFWGILILVVLAVVAVLVVVLACVSISALL